MLVWSQFGKDHLNVLLASGREFSVADSKQSRDTGEKAHKAPFLVVYHDQLYVAWVDGWSEEWGGSINLAILSI